MSGRFDLVQNINSIFPKGVEFHTIDQGDDGVIRKSSFTGPNTDLDRRLLNYNRMDGSFDSVVTPPINALDRAAMTHDIAYRSKNLDDRHAADRILLSAAEDVLNNPESSTVQKFNAGLVRVIMSAKLKIGFGMGGRVAFDPSTVPGKDNLTGLIIGLVATAGAIGIPALLKLIKDKKNKQS